jgi:uncharacterized damage-inducible protein DinB
MFPSPAAMIIGAYQQTHSRILALGEKLSQEQLHWQPAAGRQSIAFHLWHIARWADHLQAAIPGMTPELGQRLAPGVELWQAEGLAARWGFEPAQLGYAGTGMGMADDIATHLSFPPKAELLAYLQRALTAADHAVQAIDDRQFEATEQPQSLTEGIWGESTVGDAILTHLTHENRHLGMMECLVGLQTGSGTATV